MSEKVEGSVTRKLSQELNKTESRTLGALCQLDEFVLKPQFRGQSGTVVETSRNMKVEIQKPTEDRPQKDPRPKKDASIYRSTQTMILDPNDISYIVTGAYEDIWYWSPGNTSGTKVRSSIQPQFRSENNPATIEADQFLSALQQLARNSNLANFNSNRSRISKLPRSPSKAMPTFDGKSKKYKLFEDLF